MRSRVLREPIRCSDTIVRDKIQRSESGVTEYRADRVLKGYREAIGPGQSNRMLADLAA